MESFETSTCPSALPVVTRLAERAGSWTAEHQAVDRYRTSIAPMASAEGTAARPASDANDLSDVSDMTAVKGFATPAGIRSWSPPV